jgi:hypothetical protein
MISSKIKSMTNRSHITRPNSSGLKTLHRLGSVGTIDPLFSSPSVIFLVNYLYLEFEYLPAQLLADVFPFLISIIIMSHIVQNIELLLIKFKLLVIGVVDLISHIPLMLWRIIILLIDDPST